MDGVRRHPNFVIVPATLRVASSSSSDLCRLISLNYCPAARVVPIPSSIRTRSRSILSQSSLVMKTKKQNRKIISTRPSVALAYYPASCCPYTSCGFYNISYPTNRQKTAGLANQSAFRNFVTLLDTSQTGFLWSRCR